MELATTAAISAMIKKIVDFFKYAANRDVNAVVTQLVSWGAGVAVTFLVANSDFAGGMNLNGTLLANLNNWSVALLGVNLASVAGVGWDALKAVDNQNSALVPNLLGDTTVRQGVPTSTTPIDPGPR